MSDFTVSISELRTREQNLRELNAQFLSKKEELQETESGLNGMWEGDARETFHAAFSSDMIQMQNFYNAIELYCERLEDIANRYEQAEAMNVQIAEERTYA